jgi:hypothetical protein
VKEWAIVISVRPRARRHRLPSRPCCDSFGARQVQRLDIWVVEKGRGARQDPALLFLVLSETVRRRPRQAIRLPQPIVGVEDDCDDLIEPVLFEPVQSAPELDPPAPVRWASAFDLNARAPRDEVNVLVGVGLSLNSEMPRGEQLRVVAGRVVTCPGDAARSQLRANTTQKLQQLTLAEVGELRSQLGLWPARTSSAAAGGDGRRQLNRRQAPSGSRPKRLCVRLQQSLEVRS